MPHPRGKGELLKIFTQQSNIMQVLLAQDKYEECTEGIEGEEKIRSGR